MYLQLLYSFILGSALGLIFSLGRFHLPGFLNHGGCRLRSREGPRPRYLGKELNSTTLLFIGVMTAEKYLSTRAEAVYNTWGKKVPGKLEFFISYKKNLKSKLPIRFLRGVQDNEYPPQKKVMTMLRYLHDHYINDYEWFMRTDDDIYVRTEKLEMFLRSLDSSNDTVLGHGGIGKSEEVNKLGLLQGECYCLGGPGVIMSRNVLKKIAPNIKNCLSDTASTHEDVELGRCIRKFAGVTCLWAHEARDLFQQVYIDQAKAHHGTLTGTKINKALTLHPVKEPAYMFRLHSHFLSTKLRELQHNIFKKKSVLKTTEKALSAKHRGKKAVYTSRNGDFYHRSNTGSLLPWEFLTTKRVFDLASQNYRWLRQRTILSLNKVLGKTMHDLDSYYSKKLGNRKKKALQLIEIDYGYMRVDPKHGVQVSFALQTKIPEISLRLPWQPPKSIYHRTYMQQAFSELQANVVEKFLTRTEAVHFIVPLKGKLREFERFLESLREAFLIRQERIEVLIVYFPESSPPEKHLKLLNKYRLLFSRTNFMWININGEFSRAKALQQGSEYFGENSLLFFADVDLVFENEFLNRCRSNTIKGKQVYLPIMFSQYNRDIAYFGKARPATNFIYTNTAGLWRKYSFGPVCIYAEDVKTVGGFDTTITGWGEEDVNFAEKIMNSHLEIFRAQDPGLVHVFHPHTPCSDDLTKNKKKSCQLSTVSTYAPKTGLVNYMMSRKYLE